MNKLPEQIVVDILTREMALPTNTIWIRDQNRKIPNDTGLYVIVGMVDTPVVLSNTVRMIEVGDVQKEVAVVQTRENIQIDILSRSNSAILRRYEVLTALKSIYAMQQQELYEFKLARSPISFVNSSDAEGGSTLNRFSITISALVWYKIEKNTEEYYDEFATRVDDETTIGEENGLIEFTIPHGGVWFDTETWHDSDKWID